MKRAFLLFFLFLSVLLFAQAPFDPKTSFNGENPLQLKVDACTHLQTFQATVNGVPCRLLFDTGASHTTFDRAFVEKHFPHLQLYPIQIGGDTNVREQPAAFKVQTFMLGKAELRDFYAMTLPLEHLGVRVDGILGMNTMGYAPFILDIGNQVVTWFPKDTSLPEGAIPLPKLQSERKTIRLLATIEEETLPLLIDSGSSYTFFPKGLWQEDKTASPVAFHTSDINTIAQRSFTKGVPGNLKIGDATWTLTPFLSSEPGLQLGADELKKVKLFIDTEKDLIGVMP